MTSRLHLGILGVLLLPMLTCSPIYAQSWNVEWLAGLSSWGMVLDVVVQGNYAYLGEPSGLRIVNVSDLPAIIEEGFCSTPGSVYSLAVSNNYAYLACGDDELRIIDVSNPAAPLEVGFFPAYPGAQDVTISGNYAYLILMSSDLHILDLSDPALPSWMGFCPIPREAYQVVVSGEYAYVVGGSAGLYVIDITNPNTPQIVGLCDTPGSAVDVALQGYYAYVADGDMGIRVIDVADPAHPFEVGATPTPSAAARLAFNANLLCESDWETGLRFFDISTPTQPQEIGSFALAGNTLPIYSGGNLVYLGTTGLQFVIVNASDPTNPTLAGFHDLGFLEDVAVADNYAYTVGGLFGYSQGLRIIDLSDPDQPFTLGHFDTLYQPASVEVQGEFVYISDLEDGLHIINVSDPAAPIEAGQYPMSAAPDVAVSGAYAYVIENTRDLLHIIDVSNPSNPTEVSACNLPGDANNLALFRCYALVTTDSFGLRILDVSNPFHPFETGACVLTGSPHAIVVNGVYAYVAINNNSMKIVDVSSPAFPVVVNTYIAPGYVSDLALSGIYLHLASQSAGLRILNVFNPVSPVEVGYYAINSYVTDVAVSGNLIYTISPYNFDECLFLPPGSPNLAVSLIPAIPNILIPATGGGFIYTITLVSLVAPPTAFDVWIMAQLPNQTWYGPLLGPIHLMLPGCATLTRQRLQTVPGSAPAGTYLYEGRVGSYPDSVWSSDSFPFTKLGSGGWGLGTGDWTNTGEEFGGTSANWRVASTGDMTKHVPLSISPNPFNPSTAISYELRAASFVSLRVYDTAGRLVATLVNGWREAGGHEVTFDGSALPSGVYLYRLEASGSGTTPTTASGKMVLLK